MSLKAVHLIFVTLLTALAFGCAAWAFAAGDLVFGAGGIAAGFWSSSMGFIFEETEKLSYL